MGRCLGDLDKLQAVVGKHVAIEWARVDVNLQYDTINMASTMNADLVPKLSPAAIDVADI